MGSDEDTDGHPIDEYLARAAKRYRTASAPGQEAAAANLQDGAEDSHDGSTTSDDGDAAEPDSNDREPGVASAAHGKPEVSTDKNTAAVMTVISKSGGESGAEDVPGWVAVAGGTDDAKAGRPKQAQEAAPPTNAIPRGVVLVEDTAEIVRDFEVVRLLRNPRYFDDYADVETRRCFNCGQVGHTARDCTNQARVKPCYMCAQFGHDGRECPNRLCFRCGLPGHKLRDCRKQAGMAAAGRPCMRCGRHDCDAAAKGDYFRYEGGCSKAYTPADLRLVRCMSCGDLGHLLCKPALKEPSVPSCYNCGRLGHFGECCPNGTRPHLLAERRGDEERVAAELLEYETQLDREYEDKQRRESRVYPGAGGNGYDRYRDGGGGVYGQDQRRVGLGYGTALSAGYGGYNAGSQGGVSYGVGYNAGGGRGARIEWGYEPRQDDRRGSGGEAYRRYSPESFPRCGAGSGTGYDERRIKTPRW